MQFLNSLLIFKSPRWREGGRERGEEEDIHQSSKQGLLWLTIHGLRGSIQPGGPSEVLADFGGGGGGRGRGLPFLPLPLYLFLFYSNLSYYPHFVSAVCLVFFCILPL